MLLDEMPILRPKLEGVTTCSILWNGLYIKGGANIPVAPRPPSSDTRSCALGPVQSYRPSLLLPDRAQTHIRV